MIKYNLIASAAIAAIIASTSAQANTDSKLADKLFGGATAVQFMTPATAATEGYEDCGEDRFAGLLPCWANKALGGSGDDVSIDDNEE